MRKHRISAIVGLTVLALAIGFAVTAAFGAIPGTGGTITGCYKTTLGVHGTPLSIIDPSKGETCGAGNSAVNWNQTGPQGPAGPAGAASTVPGPTGATGPQGVPGSSVGALVDSGSQDAGGNYSGLGPTYNWNIPTITPTVNETCSVTLQGAVSADPNVEPANNTSELGAASVIYGIAWKTADGTIDSTTDGITSIVGYYGEGLDGIINYTALLHLTAGTTYNLGVFVDDHSANDAGTMWANETYMCFSS